MSNHETPFKYWTNVFNMRYGMFNRLYEHYGIAEETSMDDWPGDLLRAYDRTRDAADKARESDYDAWIKWAQS